MGEGQLGTLLEGRHPATGEGLAGGRGRRPTNVAFDLTFAAPKSVSVLLAVGDEQVRAAVREAQAAGAREALAYLEREACFVRRGRNGVEVLPGRGFTAGLCTHEMARSGDPHLHTHVVVANRVQGPDGRWTAPDMRPVYAAAKTAGTIADAVMRAELARALGVEWGPVREGIAELVGVPETVRAHFSARHAEILEEAAARGWGASASALSVLQRETRDHKPLIERERAQTEWRARAAEHGLGAAEVEALFARPAPAREPDAAALDRHAAHMSGPGGLTARSSTFTRGVVIEGFAAAHPQGASAARLEQLADAFLAERAVPLVPERTEPGRGRRRPCSPRPPTSSPRRGS